MKELIVPCFWIDWKTGLQVDRFLLVSSEKGIIANTCNSNMHAHVAAINKSIVQAIHYGVDTQIQNIYDQTAVLQSTVGLWQNLKIQFMR